MEPTSIETRLRARIEAKQKTRFEVIPVSGFQDMFSARYRALTYRELRKIGERHSDVEDRVEAEFLIAADVLAEACEEVLDVSAGKATPLGVNWGRAFADKMGLPHIQTARQCLLALFVDDMDLMSHRDDYFAWRDKVVIEAENETAGNSEA